MHLLGDASGPHLAYFHAWHHGGQVELDREPAPRPQTTPFVTAHG